MLLSVVWLLVLGVHGFSEQASVTVSLSRKGLGFFSSIGHKVVSRELPRIQFPVIKLPIDGGPGTGEVKVRNLRIPKFESPLFHFDLSPPDSLTWHSEGGAIRILGRWSAKYTWITTVHLHGWVEVLATGIRSLTTLSVYGHNGHPQLQIHNCSVDVLTLHLSLGGGVIPWIVNLFKEDLSYAVKNAIHEQLCATTKDVLIDEANAALDGVPKHLNVGGDIYLDYSLGARPVWVDGDHMVSQSYIDVVLGNWTCDLPVIKAEPLNNNDSFMVNVWVSETVPNCVLKSAHNAQILKFTLDRHTYSKLDTFLSTGCRFYEICMGKFFPILASNYPARHVSLNFYSSDAPQVRFSTEARQQSFFFIDFMIEPEDGKPNVTEVQARLSMTWSSSIQPVLYNARLCGKVDNSSVSLRPVFSHMGDINEGFLKTVQIVLTPIIQLSSDSLLRIGLPIPMVENITLTNSSKIETQDSVVHVLADLQYTT